MQQSLGGKPHGNARPCIELDRPKRAGLSHPGWEATRPETSGLSDPDRPGPMVARPGTTARRVVPGVP